LFITTFFLQAIPHDSRDTLAKELNVTGTGGMSNGPLIAELLQQKAPTPRSRTPTHVSVFIGDSSHW
jgi:hypothetical protein